jgi:hypothetical protein
MEYSGFFVNSVNASKLILISCLTLSDLHTTALRGPVLYATVSQKVGAPNYFYLFLLPKALVLPTRHIYFYIDAVLLFYCLSAACTACTAWSDEEWTVSAINIT